MGRCLSLPAGDRGKGMLCCWAGLDWAGLVALGPVPVLTGAGQLGEAACGGRRDHVQAA